MADPGDSIPNEIFIPAHIPAKRDGTHRWIARVTFYVTDEQARLANEGVPDVQITNDQMIGLEYGCMDCGLPYSQAYAERCWVPPGA